MADNAGRSAHILKSYLQFVQDALAHPRLGGLTTDLVLKSKTAFLEGCRSSCIGFLPLYLARPW